MLLLLVTGQKGQVIHLLHSYNVTEYNDSYKFAMTEHLKQSRQGNLLITLKVYRLGVYATMFACFYDKPILQEAEFANGVLCKKPVNASTKVETDRFY